MNLTASQILIIVAAVLATVGTLMVSDTLISGNGLAWLGASLVAYFAAHIDTR